MDVAAITRAIRAQIALSEETGELVLHEGALAQEFGVSRTPVRQALQRLAYDRMVETRSGVGTIATPLRAEAREADHRVLSALLEAAARCAGPEPVPAEAEVTLGSLAALARRAPPDGAQAFFEAEARYLRALSSLIADPVLAVAHRSSHWRVVRWHCRDWRADPHATAARLTATLDAVARACERGSLAGVLEAAGAAEAG